MRLDPTTKKTLLEIFNSVDPAARVFLFGSRANDHARGGDIDLLIDSDRLTMQDLRRARLRIYDQIGEQKIDCLLKKNVSPAFLKVIEEEGLVPL